MNATLELEPTVEAHEADCAGSLPELFRRMAAKWRASARNWQQVAAKARAQGDVASYLFAVQAAVEREEWAEREELNMKRALQRN